MYNMATHFEVLYISNNNNNKNHTPSATESYGKQADEIVNFEFLKSPLMVAW